MGLAPVARHPPFHFIPFLVAHFAPPSPHTLPACFFSLPVVPSTTVTSSWLANNPPLSIYSGSRARVI